jgi:putative DNA primase/helicase
MPLTSAGLDILTDFQRRAFDLDKDSAGLYASHVGKFGSYALRLALVTELMQWAAGDETPPPAEVSTRAIGAACDFMDDYARPMAARIYGDAALPPAERDAAQIARKIRREGHRMVNARVIRCEWRLPGLRHAAEVEEAIAFLCEAGWLTPAGTRDGDSSGRKSKDYRVNPQALED